MPTWRYIEEDGVTADFGLAADEFLLRYYPASAPTHDPTLRLYTYKSHCALVGRFQNLEAELNLQTCRELGVQFGRRPTGGGAILMGQDQLGLCFTAPANFDNQVANPLEIYRRFSAPVVQALAKLGIEARFRPKNDLEVNGKKIAGLGVYYDPHGAMLFHTSLLVDLDVALMLRLLRIPLEKFSDKPETNSVVQRVTTVARELQRRISLSEVRQQVKQSFAAIFQTQLQPEPWSEEEKSQIAKLAREKYSSDEWLLQRSPQPDMTGMSLKKTAAGLLRTYIGLKGEIIKHVLIAGDFFQHDDALTGIESRLKWSAFDKNAIAQRVHQAFSQNGHAPARCSPEDLVEAIWKAGVNARAKQRLTNKGSCYYPLSKTPAEI